MSYTLHVSRFTHECPNWWRNFLQSLRSTDSSVVYYDSINENLESWNAVYFDQVVSKPVVMCDTKKMLPCLF